MKLAIAGIIANLFATLIVASDPEYAGIVYLMFIFWLISAIGLVFALCKQEKLGGVLIIVGCALFAPLGLIGVFGGVKLIESTKIKDLEARRNALNEKKQ